MELKKKLRFGVIGAAVLAAVFLAYIAFANAYAAVKGASLSDVAFLLAGEVEQDKEGRTNILLVGSGGGDHPGGNLTDSIMIASYHHTESTATLISIPRDLWVQKLGSRINRYYEQELNRTKSPDAAMASMTTFLGDMLGMDVPYYVKIEFQGFVDIVNGLGGVDVVVAETVIDPLYPCADMVKYCPFSIQKGPAHLDGETALKYARSRETTSDFSRSARQQIILSALKEKLGTSGILSSPRQLRALYETATEHVLTNMTFPEMLRMGKLAKGFDKNKLTAAQLSYEPKEIGGFLEPGVRADYGGAAVVLPADKTGWQIQKFAELATAHAYILVDKRRVQILNASNLGAIGSDLGYLLNRYGFNTVKAENYPGKKKMEQSAVYVPGLGSTSEMPEVAARIASAQKTAEALGMLLGLPVYDAPPDIAGLGEDVYLVIGNTYKTPKELK